MTPEEFEREMRAIEAKYQKNHDHEMAHMDADALLCRVLEEAGYRKGVRVFTRLDKWYA